MKNLETVNLVKQIDRVIDDVVSYDINGDVVNLRDRAGSTVAAVRTSVEKTSIINMITSRVVNVDISASPDVIVVIISLMLGTKGSVAAELGRLNDTKESVSAT